MFKKKKVEHDVDINFEFRFYPDNTAIIQTQSQAKNEWAQLIGELMTFAYLVRHGANYAGSNKDLMLYGLKLGSQFRQEIDKSPNPFRKMINQEIIKPKRILNNSFWISIEEGKWNGDWKPMVTFGDNCWEESVFLLLEHLSNIHAEDMEFLTFLDNICDELVTLWKNKQISNFFVPGNLVLTICDPYLKKYMQTMWKSQGMTDDQIDGILEQIDFLHSAEEAIGSKFTEKDMQFILSGKSNGKSVL